MINPGCFGDDVAAWVERSRGLLGALLKFGSIDVQPPAVQAINDVLESSPQIRNIRWHFASDFSKGNEDGGEAKPF
ncbi:MAG: hypothetical protein WA823_16660 [Candidatus Acidiferrales bacterium]